MRTQDNRRLKETIELPEIDLTDFSAKQVVYEIPVVAFNKKITYLLIKTSNDKLVCAVKG